MNKVTTCGVYCETECRAYSRECDGCNKLKGKVSWAKFYGKDICPIYKCAKEKSFVTCAECSQIPCKIWFDTRNPDLTDDEFDQEIQGRLKNLNR